MIKKIGNVVFGKYRSLIVGGSFTFAALIYFFNSVGNVSQAVFLKYYQEKLHVDLYEFMTLRGLIETIILLPFGIKYIGLFKKHAPVILLLCGLYSLDMLLFHRGVKTVPVTMAALIMLLIPIWIVIFGRILLKENKFNVVNAICLLACLFGIVFPMYKEIQFGGFNDGYLFLFADSIAIPLGLLLQKKYSEFRPVVFALFTNAIVLTCVGYCLSGFKMTPLTPETAKGATIVAFTDILEFACVYIAYKMTDCALLQPIRFTRVFLSMILGYFVLGEKTGSHQLIGIFIIVFANIFSLVYERKREKVASK